MSSKKSPKKIILIAISLLIIIAIVSVIKKKSQLNKARKSEEEKARIHLYTVTTGNIQRSMDYLAFAEPEKDTMIKPRISAPIEKIFVDEGSMVKEGDLLANLDTRELSASKNEAFEKLEALKFSYSAKQNAIKSLKFKLDYAKRDFERNKKLYDQKAISFNKFDASQTNYNAISQEYESAKSSLKSMKSQIKSTKSVLDRINLNLSYTKIESPFSGIIVRRFFDEGALVSPATPIFRITTINSYKLSFNVSQDESILIKIGTKLLYNFNNKTYSTKISNIFPSLDNNITLRVEAIIKNIPDLIDNTQIPVKVIFKEKTALRIPKTSILNSNSVFLIVNGRLKIKKIKTGFKGDNFVEIISGLKKGDKIANEPFLTLNLFHDGQAIEGE